MDDSATVQVAAAEAAGRLIPRLYQQEIFQRAVNENVVCPSPIADQPSLTPDGFSPKICAMDTGSGKTQIAVMLLKHIMSLRPADSNPKKASIPATWLANENV
ncbi:hypothetical protein RSOLAG1IB_00625 [Rhizoctonia solani AG-1 IB]|uniref:Uncharacterized protein n=1 Tax=Thanatephorus cucumeris (strain AG1-IB / isolate 7/3/14) TaxID=1108050 RepID=A0A0B7F7D3_THACB|nr:hypothetical protein RSOLAG1IB_00625 [Rhizoctonia solani AG-1 IB]